MAKRGENIYKRKDGRWEGRFIKGYDLSGKAQYGYMYAHSYADVKEKLNQKRGGSLLQCGNSERIVYQDLITAWLNSLQINIKESTYARYYHLAHSHIIPRLGKYKVDRITNRTIEEYNGFVKGNNFEGYLNDWEGHDPTQFRTNMFDAPELRTINPSDIEGISLGDNDIADPAIFWSQHMTGGTENSFKEIAALIPEVQKELSMGRSLDDLIEDPRLGKCASLYFDPANMPEVIECDGYYEFQSNGRHRILAAREMGYDMPVKVIGTRNRITADGILNENMGKASVSTIHNTERKRQPSSVLVNSVALI